MKFNLASLTTLLLLLFVQTVSAQAICGFDGTNEKKMKEDPAYRNAVQQTEAGIRSYILRHKTQLEARVSGTNTAMYTIPVVVHVIHTGGAIGSIYNPTDAQILGAISYLNNVYNGTDPSLSGGIGDLQIQFVMAQRDPNCNPTNGINRVNGSGVAGYVAGGVKNSTGTGTAEINIKNLSRWPNTDYYNVWIVNKIDGNDGTSGQFIAGYAYFPGASASIDGIVMLATQMKANQKTLPHEIGHAFNLYHPFQGSPDKNTCPAVTGGGCSVDGDQVCDTDPITYNQLAGVIDFTCRTGPNTCGGSYSINTESNYMNYTSCYTLFTAGQRSRILASAGSSPRLSLSTSLGGTPTTSASACSPKIDFEFTEDQMTETTSGTLGCRSYKDYSYNMVIGNDPSMPATATLNIASGTATEGVDFDITTNGSFSSPSKILNFPAGSHAAQAFTVRIYDDAIVESTETVTLGFTVSNGGGTALKGDGRINLAITINDNDAAPFGPSSITKLIGANSTTLQSPFAGANAKQKSQVIYKASELTAAGIPAGNITGLALTLYKNSGSSFVYQGLTIKMGQTTHGSLYNGSTEFPLSDASYTTVYSNNYTTVDGLNSFTFSTPFVWDGTSNVVVEICYDDGATTGANDNCQSYTDGSANSSYVFQNGINCGGSYSSFSLYNTGNKPIIQFTYPDQGTQVQTVLNTSRQEYLGPNADVYFYDQSTGKLMVRITNTSSFDYGCTQVAIDRNNISAGANAVPFWDNTTADYLISKTWKVTPTTNNPSGTYQISLYYTQAEINAWQTATSQSAGSLQMYKVSSQISDVTPANPTGGGTVVMSAPAISTLGTNTVLTANFTNGFSGFGAGIASSLLPVSLLDFNGVLNTAGVVLNWSTSSETNSKSFDAERSYDGVSFSKLGSVDAAGNSTVKRYYSLTDPAASKDNNYYRLKQIDLDGKFIYSKVILIKGNQVASFRVISNPFSNVLEIAFDKVQSGQADIKLSDVAGKDIYHATADAAGQTRLKIDLTGRNISAGIYLLQVKTSQGQFIQRVVKQ